MDKLHKYFSQALLLIIFAAGHGITKAQQISDSLIVSVNMKQAIVDGWLDPGMETVGLRGDVRPLSWGTTFSGSDDKGDGIYQIAVPFAFSADSLVLSFKVKVDGTDNPNDGWQEGQNHQAVIRKNRKNRISLSWEDEAVSPPSTITGNVQIIRNFDSAPLEKRDIYIYLPPGYNESDERYPVIYMHDGQNLFDASAAGMEWKMDEAAEELISQGSIEPMIIVGISNTADRIDEYTPSRQIWHHELRRMGTPLSNNLSHLTGTFITGDGDSILFKARNDTLFAKIPGSDNWQALIPENKKEYYHPRAGITFRFKKNGEKPVSTIIADKPPMGGKGSVYGKFIVNTLKPKIDSELRTLPGPESTGLAGSSLGGLITMHMGLQYPEIFGMLYLLSPSVWWDQRFILDEIMEFPAPTSQPVWLYIGSGEGDGAVQGTRDLRETLLNKGWDPESISYTETENAPHNERAWSDQAKNILLDFSSRIKKE